MLVHEDKTGGFPRDFLIRRRAIWSFTLQRWDKERGNVEHIKAKVKVMKVKKYVFMFG